MWRDFATNFLNIFVNVMTILVIARAIVSWIPNAHGRVSDFIVKATDPFLNPIRHFVPIIGGVDFSPLVLFFILQLVRGLIDRLFGI